MISGEDCYEGEEWGAWSCQVKEAVWVLGEVIQGFPKYIKLEPTHKHVDV